MQTALQLAKKLRNGMSVSFCDSTISFRGGEFEETHMALSHYDDGHYFPRMRLSWKEVRSLLKGGAYH